MSSFPFFALRVIRFAVPAASALIVSALAVLPAQAQAPRAGFGGQTDAWLAMQLNPAYTANDQRPIPGEVANRSYLRYLDSFTHPIPGQFERQSFLGGGGGGYSGGGGSSSGASAGP